MAPWDNVVDVIALVGALGAIGVAYYSVRVSKSRLREAARQTEQLIIQYRFQALSTVAKELEGQRDARRDLYKESGRHKDWDGMPESVRNAIDNMWSTFHHIGVMLEQDLLEPDLLFARYSSVIVRFWDFSREFLAHVRSKRNFPTYKDGFESLASQAKEFREQKGYPEISWDG